MIKCFMRGEQAKQRRIVVEHLADVLSVNCIWVHAQNVSALPVQSRDKSTSVHRADAIRHRLHDRIGVFIRGIQTGS